MNLRKNSLHDALLKNLRIDFLKKSVAIDFEYYEDDQSPERRAASMIFDDVEALSQIVNLIELSKHSFAGHINYWISDRKSGNTYIYLAAGCLVVRAKKAHIELKNKRKSQ